MNFFRRKPKRAVIAVIPTTRMRLEQWRRNPSLVDAARKLFETREFQTIISVLRNESPASYGLSIGSSHDDHVAHAYKAEGYNLCLNTLEEFAVHQRQESPIEATFEAEPPHPISPTSTYSDLEEPPINRM